jgi:hypothetical protein
LPEFRKPDPKLYTPEEINKLEEAVRTIAGKYPKFDESEILDKIVTISDELRSVIYRDQLKKLGEDSLIELTSIHAFIKKLNPRDIRKMEMVITSPTGLRADDLPIKSEYVIFNVMNFLSTLENPARKERPKGGQEGGSIYNQVVKDNAIILYSSYRLSFKSDRQTFLFIQMILEAAGYITSLNNIKNNILDKDSRFLWRAVI